MRRTLEIVSVQGNSAAGKKSIIMPVGLDYIAALLAGETAVDTDVTNLKEKLNTELVRDITGTDQNDMNLTDRIADMGVDSILRIPFEMMGMKNIATQYGTTRNTMSPDPETGNAINGMILEWTDGTTDEWRVFAEADDATTGGPGGITRFQKVTPQVAASSNYSSSIQSFIQFGSPDRRFFRRGFFLISAGTLDGGDVVIQRGNAKDEILHRTAVLNVRELTDANVRAVPTNYDTAAGGMIIDTTETGISETFDTMRPASDAEQKAQVHPQGYAIMGGVAVMPQTMFDIRFSPDTGGALQALTETLGRL